MVVTSTLHPLSEDNYITGTIAWKETYSGLNILSVPAAHLTNSANSLNFIQVNREIELVILGRWDETNMMFCVRAHLFGDLEQRPHTVIQRGQKETFTASSGSQFFSFMLLLYLFSRVMGAVHCTFHRTAFTTLPALNFSQQALT